ncbi:hypothetical protein ABK046_50255, partial [Streptomyces caeruleatus]
RVARDGTDVVAASPAEELMCVRVTDLGGDFDQLSFSSVATLHLKEIAIDDLLQKSGGAQFARLLTTRSDADVVDTNFVDIS